jgi:hypothetical protein
MVLNTILPPDSTTRWGRLKRGHNASFLIVVISEDQRLQNFEDFFLDVFSMKSYLRNALLYIHQTAIKVIRRGQKETIFFSILQKAEIQQ